MRFIAALPAGLLATLCLAASTPAEAPPAGQLDDRAHPVRMDLHLRIDPKADRFSGRVRLDVALTRETDLIWLHGRDLDVSAVSFITKAGDAIEARYEEMPGSGVAAVHLARAYAGEAIMEFAYSGALKEGMFGLYLTEEAGLRYVASQMQDSHFRRAAPGFDQPRFKVPTTIAIEAPPGNAVISNAPQTSETTLADGWLRHTFAETPPLPAELLAIAVGPYDVVQGRDIPPTKLRSHPIPLRAVVAKGQGAKVDYALQTAAELLPILEDYFGIPYPYAKLDLVGPTRFMAAGMENAGAIFYRQDLLLTAADAAPSARNYFLQVHAHELAHMWFGDLVTPQWWTDLWLSEAFATWMGGKVAAAWSTREDTERTSAADAMGVMKYDSLATARAVRTPIERTEQVMGAFNNFTYGKGAAVLTMFESFLGKDIFREGVRRYVARFAHGTARFEDFAAAMADASGNPAVGSALADFVNQPGMPLLTVNVDCSGGKALARVSQAAYRPLGSTMSTDRRWRTPFCLSHRTGGKWSRTCSVLTGATATLELNTPGCPNTVMPNAGASGYYRFALDDAGWDALRAEFAQLPAAEALAFTDSLEAGFNAGIIGGKAYLDGLTVAARSPYGDVSMAALHAFRRLFAMLDAKDASRLAARIATAYGGRAKSSSSSTEEQSLQDELSRARIVDLHDPAVMAEFAGTARALLTGDGDGDGASAPLIREAVTAALMVDGEAFYEALLKSMRQADSPLMRDIVALGIAGIWDPKLAARVRRDMLATDAFAGWQIRYMLDAFFNEAALRDGTWEWLQANVDAVLKKLEPHDRAQFGSLVGGCDLAHSGQVEAFLKTHAAQLPRYENFTVRARESVRLCAALRTARAGELAAALRSQHASIQ